MAREPWRLTDEHWNKLKRFLPEPKASPRGGPKPIPNRRVLEGILWVLYTGARWRDLPREFPSPTTCWRRLHDWEEQGAWLKVWRAFLTELDRQGRLDWEETFADATFAPAKKGASKSVKPRKERAQSFWWWQTVRVFRWEFTPLRPRRAKST